MKDNRFEKEDPYIIVVYNTSMAFFCVHKNIKFAERNESFKCQRDGKSDKSQHYLKR